MAKLCILHVPLVPVGYIPSGMTVHEWHNFQRAEKRKLKSKDFGSIGPTSFKSRSLQAFQEDLEKGKVSSFLIVVMSLFQ